MASASDDPSVARVTEIRARPTLTAPLPEGWFFKESLTLLAPAADANVIASSEPIPDGLSPEDYAKLQGDILRQDFRGYHEHAFEPAVLFGGKAAWVRRFEWSPEESQPVMQIQVYYTESGRGYTATATTTRDNFNSVELTLTEILDGLMIETDDERTAEAESLLEARMSASSEQVGSTTAQGDAIASPNVERSLEG